jgi:heptose-I-phosphate ethanolaminephosphotransferase
VYFSDHGDEVFHDIDFVGHSEYQGTNAMYEVPFLLWMSEDFKAFHPRADSLKAYTNRKYLLDDFIHSLFDLGRIQYNLHEPERSLFHPNFKPRKRIIQDRNDFDAR